MSDYIAEVFGEGGLLATSELKARVRPGQIEMARAVDRAIQSGGKLLCEAGTGTGKTFAYLIPAIKRQLRTIVVTRNNLLADQLFRKDLPTLKRLLPWPFEFAQIKGKARYLCVEKYPPGGSRLALQRDEDIDVDDRVAEWALTTQTGDFAEMSFDIPDHLRVRYTASQDECKRRACDTFKRGACHYYNAKKVASLASVVVTNYHVYFSNMRFGRILPAHDVAIMDEGHDAPDIARDFWGFRVTNGAVKRMAHMVGEFSTAARDDEDVLKNELVEAGNRLFGELADYRRSNPGIRIKAPLPVAYQDVVSLLKEVGGRLGGEAEGLVEIDPAEAANLNRHAERATELADQIVEVCTVKHPKKFVYQIEGDRADLTSRAINPADFLAPHLNDAPPPPERSSAAEGDDGIYEDDEPKKKKGRVLVVTSATLTTPDLGGRLSFEYLRGTLGVEGPATCLADSPFDLTRQALLVIPYEAPRPPEGRLSPATRAERTKAWQQGIGSMVVKVVERARGRTLALFTSLASMRAAHDALMTARLPYRVLVQGGGIPNAKMVELFRDDASSVLLGVDSFWQGVDVPGESLSCVVIDKLPYKHGAIDPVLDAVEEQMGRDRAFTEYNLPRTIIQFRQAFGRLIRTERDKGVVVMLDPRVIERNRNQFLGTMPGVPLSRDIEDIAPFLDGVAKKPFIMPPPPRVGMR